MRKNLIALLFLTGATAMAVIACGGDDNNGTPITTDGGPLTDGSSTSPNPDGSTTPPNDGSMGDDSSTDSGCGFTDFVIDQVKNHTNGTEAPNATIPTTDCANSGPAGQFSSLFP